MEIDLFDDGTGNDILGEIKSNGWLINEANLTKIDFNKGQFFIDPPFINLLAATI